MKISDHIDSKKMQFEAQTPFGILTRHAFVFLVSGKEASCLVDAGILPLLPEIEAFLADCGKTPKEIREIVITHNHSDHIGALKPLREACACTVTAPDAEAAWIENTELQFVQRPVPRFHEFVGGSVAVDRRLHDGDTIELGDSTLLAICVPGHAPGHMAYLHLQDGVLLSGDSIPVPGAMPVYEDVLAEVRTLRRLRALEGVKTLLMSWDDPHFGEENVHAVLDAALSYVERIHALTRQGVFKYGREQTEPVARFVHDALNLPASEFTQMFIGTVAAHIAVLDADIGSIA